MKVLFDLFEEFSDNPIIDRAVLDKECAYGYYENACALVAYVKDNNVIPFEEQSADYYHSGQKFPASVALKDLVYLIPYVKGKGIKDVYKIERIRVGTKTGEVPDKYSKDLRLVFDIKYEGTLFEKYKKTSVDIFRTYRLTTIKELKELK